MRTLKDYLPEVIEQKEVLRAAKALKTLAKWEDVVGKFLAEHCQVERFRSGTLWIKVDGSSWAQELLLRKEQILCKLNEMANEKELFQELRARQG